MRQSLASTVSHCQRVAVGVSLHCHPLVARRLPRDYLSDTPPYWALWGFWCLSMANWARYPLSLLWAFPPRRECEVEVRYPPANGHLSDTCAIPYETRQNACDTPLCDTVSKRYCAIWGGISHWAAKCHPCRHANAQKGLSEFGETWLSR